MPLTPGLRRRYTKQGLRSEIVRVLRSDYFLPNHCVTAHKNNLRLHADMYADAARCLAVVTEQILAHELRVCGWWHLHPTIVTGTTLEPLDCGHPLYKIGFDSIPDPTFTPEDFLAERDAAAQMFPKIREALGQRFSWDEARWVAARLDALHRRYGYAHAVDWRVVNSQNEDECRENEEYIQQCEAAGYRTQSRLKTYLSPERYARHLMTVVFKAEP